MPSNCCKQPFNGMACKVTPEDLSCRYQLKDLINTMYENNLWLLTSTKTWLFKCLFDVFIAPIVICLILEIPCLFGPDCRVKVMVELRS